MEHYFSEFLEKMNIPIDDVALLFHSEKNAEFKKCKQLGMIDEYQRLQCTKNKTDYFADKSYILSFIRDGHGNAIFYGCYNNVGKMITKPAVNDLTIKGFEIFPYPEWYEWIGKETPGGNGTQYYYRLMLISKFSDLRSKLTLHNTALKTVQYNIKVLNSKMVTISDPILEQKYFGGISLSL